MRQRLNNELDGQKLMQRVFSPDNPVLWVVGEIDTQTNKDTQQGYMMIFSGAMSAIRNPKAHENMTISKDDAMGCWRRDGVSLECRYERIRGIRRGAC